jgi:hypothetical protein
MPTSSCCAHHPVATLQPALQVFAVVDKDSDGKVDYVHSLVEGGINTPNGIALQGTSLFVASYEDKGGQDTTPKGLIWRLDDVHQYALQKKVSLLLSGSSQCQSNKPS